MEIYPDGKGINYSSKDFERPLARTFWLAFLDGFSMAGLGAKLRIPGTPERLFLEDHMVVDLADAEDLKRAFDQLDPESLHRIKEALHEAETAHQD